MSMNRSQAERFRDIHLNHKYNLVHMLPSTEVPALSGFYLKSFYNGTKRYRLKLPESITEADNKFCGNCGAVRIPLFNTKMSIAESDSGNASGSTKTLQYTCLHCEHQAQLAPIKVQKQSIESPGQNLETKKDEQRQEKVNKKSSSARERAKKRKKNTLSNMLSQKNEEKKNKSFSLSLESMMKE